MAAMPSHSPHASHPSTFQAPGWGAPTLLSSYRRWRNATSRKLVPFSHRSASRIFIRQPGCIPSPMVTQDGDHQFDGGEKHAGLRPLPCPQLQGSPSSLLGRRARLSRGLPSRGLASRFFLRLLGVETILQLCGGGALQPCRGRRTAAAQSRVQQSVLCPGDSGQPHQGVSQHVVRREGGTRVLGRSHSRFHGEDGSEDLLVRFGAAGARWCGVGGQVNTAVSAEVVAAGDSVRRRRDRQRHPRTDLRLFGFNVWFSSLEWGREREPFSGSVRPGTIAAAVEVAGESPRACRPTGSPMWRLFIPTRVEPELRL
jgi:hypothetical protein